MVIVLLGVLTHPLDTHCVVGFRIMGWIVPHWHSEARTFSQLCIKELKMTRLGVNLSKVFSARFEILWKTHQNTQKTSSHKKQKIQTV